MKMNPTNKTNAGKPVRIHSGTDHRSIPLRTLATGKFSGIIIKLTLGLMSLLFGFDPKLVKRFIY
jgi:hypothetical protein